MDEDDNFEDLNEDLEQEDRGDLFEEDEENEEEDVEDSEEEDEEDEDSDDDEEEEEPEKPTKDIKIPKSRLDEVIRQREEAKERNLWLEEQLEKLINQQVIKAPDTPIKPKEPEYDFDAAEEQYITLVIEGDISKAAKLRSEINKARQAEFNAMVDGIKETALKDAKSEGFKAVQEQSFGTLIANMESKYKFLDHKSDDYNEEAVDTVNTLLNGYVSKGMSKVEALQKAIGKVVPMFVKEEPKKQSLGNKRVTEAGKKAVKAAKSQPAASKSPSIKSKNVEITSVAKLSENDFSKLTEREKKILRGD